MKHDVSIEIPQALIKHAVGPTKHTGCWCRTATFEPKYVTLEGRVISHMGKSSNSSKGTVAKV